VQVPEQFPAASFAQVLVIRSLPVVTPLGSIPSVAFDTWALANNSAKQVTPQNAIFKQLII